MANRPCLDCRQPSQRTRCPACTSRRNSQRAAARSHYRGDYQTRAKAVRDQANADPTTTCWRCHEPTRPNDPWQAGHLVDGDPTSPLAPEHRSCNARAGANLTNRHR